MRLSHTLLVFHILFAPLTRLIFLFLGSNLANHLIPAPGFCSTASLTAELPSPSSPEYRFSRESHLHLFYRHFHEPFTLSSQLRAALYKCILYDEKRQDVRVLSG